MKMGKRRQIDYTKRPKCPYCKAQHTHNGGPNQWVCAECGRRWRKKYLERKRIYRPDVSCPRCSGHHIRSCGVRWYCNDCSKSWKKPEFLIGAGRKKWLPRPDGLRCPDCKKEKNIISKHSLLGIWKCFSCGRSFKFPPNLYKGAKKVYRPNNPCPNCKSLHVISAGKNWRCDDCGRNWVKKITERKHPLWTKKEDKIIKQCYPNKERNFILAKIDSKRNWESVKRRANDLGVHRIIRKKIRPKGLKCPECGSENLHGHGINWGCSDCGRCWRKIYREQQQTDLYQSYKTKIGEPIVLS